jgi:hypothetical protein
LFHPVLCCPLCNTIVKPVKRHPIINNLELFRKKKLTIWNFTDNSRTGENQEGNFAAPYIYFRHIVHIEDITKILICIGKKINH